jgi:aldehyde:ferredoxin oxidoreductase
MRIIQIQRALLLLGGPNTKWKPKIDDENPARFYEPLPSGPKKGQKVEKKKFEDLRNEYYAAVGWDEKGIPKSETLKNLGLDDIDKILQQKLS